VLPCVAARCSAMISRVKAQAFQVQKKQYSQCVAACCSALQCVAACCSAMNSRVKIQGSKVQKKLDNLRHLKKESGNLLSHTYPVGELPALCTPRMYQALHDHTARSFTVGPPQFTPGGVKDLVQLCIRVYKRERARERERERERTRQRKPETER